MRAIVPWASRFAICGLLLLVFCMPTQRFAMHPPTARPTATARAAGGAQLPSAVDDAFAALVQSDPVGAFRAALERHQRSVRDYTCTFEKQEQVGGRLTSEQVTRVLFRETPFSVNMLWTRNEDKARRAIYVEGRWTGEKGEKLAVFEPAGGLARLFVDEVFRPIHGPEVRKAVRRSIDEFGFANTLRRILEFCDLGAKRHEMDIRYVGQGTLAGRPTHMIERRLPYTDENGRYPDRLLVVHLDQEYQLPTGCISYADEAKTKLLGSYVFTDVQFNVGLTDRDFARKGE